MNPTPKKQKAGFTLVELLVVIALIAIIASLAISRLSSVRDKAKAKLNVANLTRIGAYVDANLAATEHHLNFNRLDALMFKDTPDGANTNFATMTTNLDPLISHTPTGTNGILLHHSLVAGSPAYGGFPGILSPYYLTPSDVNTLSNDLGLTYLMRGTDGGRFTSGDDGVWAQGSITDPLKASCVAKALSNGVCVAVVNPGAVISEGHNIAPIGTCIYKSCGQNAGYTTTQKIRIDDVDYDDAQSAFTALNQQGGGGILLAFGIGEFASIVGDDNAGLDSAPICPIIHNPDEYNRYLILIRLQTTRAGERKASYAGLIDATGQPISEARRSLND